MWRARARTWSGVILFAFVLTHLSNHAVGLISLEAMDAVRDYRTAVWRSLPGTVLLYGALTIHIALSLYKVARQRTWRMTFWQAVQLAFGVAIPLLLFRHIIGTRLSHELFEINDGYIDYALWVMWPGEAYTQLVLIGLVWIHACVGLHFWLRLKPWYRAAQWVLYAAAILVPVLSYAGFAVAGRGVRVFYAFKNQYGKGQVAYLQTLVEAALWVVLAIISAVFLFRMVRMVLDRVRPRVRVNYGDGNIVISRIGPTLLEISRAYGIPHASVCGGRARCSTCRVRIVEGFEHVPEPEQLEQRVLERIGAGRNVRLACQLAPSGDVTIARLLPARGASPEDVSIQDKYAWGVEQEVTIMFADIRGFTSLSENRLPFDVVFLLNQFLSSMGKAIEDAGGYVDKFLGDGIMAIFGIDLPTQQGAHDAVSAAKDMGDVLDKLNDSLSLDLPKGLNIGIGIHTGTVILGRVGDAGETGSTQRITALGDAVNTASRLEAVSKDLSAQLVVSAQTIAASGINFAKKRRKVIRIRGKENEVSVLVFKRASALTLEHKTGAKNKPAGQAVLK